MTSACGEIKQRQAHWGLREEQSDWQMLLWPSVHSQNSAEEIFLEQKLYLVTSCLKPKSKNFSTWSVLDSHSSFVIRSCKLCFSNSTYASCKGPCCGPHSQAQWEGLRFLVHSQHLPQDSPSMLRTGQREGILSPNSTTLTQMKTEF